MKLKKLFGSNASTSNATFVNKSTIHGCPFCKCKSLDPSLRQISERPDTSYKIYLGKQFLDNKNKNKSLEGNIYYRTFQSPKRRGLSPNTNRKIVIKYSNPPLNQQSIVSKNKILSELDNSMKKSVFFQENPKIKKNIYLNQNTPPKSKFLTKRSSSRQKVVELFKKRNSNQEQKQSQNQPKLTTAESQEIKVLPQQAKDNQLNKIRVLQREEPSETNSNTYIRYYRVGDNNKLEVSPIKPNILNNLNYVQSKNTIQRLSSPRASSSPLGSAQQSSTQVFPFIFQKSLQKAKQQRQNDRIQQMDNNEKIKTIQKNKSRQNIDYNYSESDNNGTSQKKVNFHVYNKDSLKNIESSPLNLIKQKKVQTFHTKYINGQEGMQNQLNSEAKLSEYELASQLSEDLNLNYDYYEGQQNSDLSISANVVF